MVTPEEWGMEPTTDDEVRERLRQFAAVLREVGLLGASAASVGEAREAGPAVRNPLDGLAPNIRSVPQPDR